ncbi:FAD-dependent monooxygenase [Streptomyces sp. NBC_00178]|uniref:FAD-dependent monooxygenase n=1 Tax=Streptomyces sp. NBC_00178 TaxID=2975672 RepID=UPI002E28D977|nr:FAD-dependent monooxygenase [Streptomyces sp. NBC_00178]
MSQKIDVDVPVLIVGGGGAGLTSSILLSRLGIRSLLVTRYPDTTTLPRGHYLNQRSMEILADMGVAPDIRAKATPLENMRGVAWYSGLAGGGPEDGHGRLLGFLESLGAGHADPDHIAASPEAGANLSLLHTEPILRKHAESYPEAAVRFHHELVGTEQDAHGVTSTILNRSTGETYTVRSAYLLGADAGRTVGNLVGAKVATHERMRKLVSLYLAMDLSQYLPGDDSMITWVFNPEFPEHLEYGAVLVPQGPTRWGRHSEEWTLAVSRPDLDGSETEKMLRWASEALGLPDIEAKVLGVSEWNLELFLLDDFRVGRTFLLGDAAHRLPPAGGLGLNGAIQDAYNLCWKIAAVLDGRADDGLLDTYSAERHPVAQHNIETASKAVGNQDSMASALGLSTSESAEDNWAALSKFWDDDLPGAAERRHRFNEWLGMATLEFNQHNVAMGYSYDSAAIVGDGTPPPVSPDEIRLYQPSSRPGHALPHAWVERSNERLALRSLIHDGHFALIAGEQGQAWVEAAEDIARTRGIPLRSARVGLGKVDLIDIRLAWKRSRTISAEGALLIRPDGYIAFRSINADDDPLACLTAAFDQILPRPSS